MKTVYKNDSYKVLNNSEWQEFIVVPLNVKPSLASGHKEAYFTNDKNDAILTCNNMKG